MVSNDKLSTKEVEILDAIVARFSKRAKHATTWDFNIFITEWINFIKEVEKGYTLTIDDYTNDVSKRDLIDELSQQISKDLKNKVNQLIEFWDISFQNTTNDLIKPLSSRENAKWWWYKIPKKLVGELKKDVKSLKIA